MKIRIVLAGALLALGGVDQAYADTQDPKEILRSAEEKLQSGKAYTFICRAQSKAGKTQFVKFIQRYDEQNRLFLRNYEFKDKLADAVSDTGELDAIQTLFRGDEMWILSGRKKAAYRLTMEPSPMVSYSHQAELKQSTSCAIDYYNDPRVTYDLKEESVGGIHYRIISRHISDDARRQLKTCRVTPAAVINSIICPSAKELPISSYPSRIDYYIDDRGISMRTKSFNPAGLLLDDAILESCDETVDSGKGVFDIPARYNVSVVDTPIAYAAMMKGI